MSNFQHIENWYFQTSLVDRTAIFLTGLILGFTLIDPIFYYLGTHINKDIIEFSRAISHLGRGGVVLIPAGLVMIAASLLADINSNRRLRAAYSHFRNTAAFIFASVALAGLIALLFKNLLGRARPKFFDEFGSFYFLPLTFDASLASFPSGHATTSFACAAAIGFLSPNWRFTAFTFALWIALSRYLISAHYLTDILIGSLLGSIVAIYVKRHFTEKGLLFRKTAKKHQTRTQGARLTNWYLQEHLPHRLNTMLKSEHNLSRVKPALMVLKKIRL